MSNTKFLTLTLCLLLAWAATSCLKNVDNTSSGPKAGLSISNYAINAAGLQVIFDDNPVSPNQLLFGSTTDSGGNSYLRVPAGIHKLRLTSGTESIVDKNIVVKANTNYSLFVYDTLKGNAAKVLLLENEPVVDTVVKARFLHFVPGTDTLTAVIIRDAIGLAIPQTYMGGQSDTESNGGFPVTLTPGSYRVQLLKRNAVVFSLASFQMVAGKQYSLAAIGSQGGNSVYSERVVVIEHD